MLPVGQWLQRGARQYYPLLLLHIIGNWEIGFKPHEQSVEILPLRSHPSILIPGEYEEAVLAGELEVVDGARVQVDIKHLAAGRDDLLGLEGLHFDEVAPLLNQSLQGYSIWVVLFFVKCVIIEFVCLVIDAGNEDFGSIWE